MGRSSAGWGSGLVGVAIFSGSLPATRLAVARLSPLFLTSARAVIAAILGAVFLVAYRQSWPRRGDFWALALVAGGVVIGFPLLSGLALVHMNASHAIVFIGLLPLATALFGVLRGAERPEPLFWVFSGIGAATVAGFALFGTPVLGGISESAPRDDLMGDALMLAAVLLCGLGYAEGATLSRRLGGWQVISWALLLALPLMASLSVWSAPRDMAAIGASVWVSLAYLGCGSMFLGFVFWYRGLARGGIARVGQLQLLQPFGGLVLAALVLGEAVPWSACLSTLIVVLCVAGAKQAGNRQAGGRPC